MFSTLVVNVRYLLMGAALRRWFSKLSATKSYASVFFMGDENWALTMREFAAGGRQGAFLLGSGLLFFVTWLTATVLGHSLGTTVRDPARWGLDFAFTAVFAALLTTMWKRRSDLLQWAVAGICSLAAAQWLPGKWYILIGGIAGAMALIATVIVAARFGNVLLAMATGIGTAWLLRNVL